MNDASSEDGNPPPIALNEPTAASLEPQAPPPRPPRFQYSITELFIVLLILGVLAAIYIPSERMARHRANTRACYANQKTIAGAIEMYSLDTTGMKEPDVLNILLRGGYLQAMPLDPGETDPNSQEHYRFGSDGSDLRCLVHGPIQDRTASVTRSAP